MQSPPGKTNHSSPTMVDHDKTWKTIQIYLENRIHWIYQIQSCLQQELHLSCVYNVTLSWQKWYSFLTNHMSFRLLGAGQYGRVYEQRLNKPCHVFPLAFKYMHQMDLARWEYICQQLPNVYLEEEAWPHFVHLIGYFVLIRDSRESHLKDESFKQATTTCEPPCAWLPLPEYVSKRKPIAKSLIQDVPFKKRRFVRKRLEFDDSLSTNADTDTFATKMTTASMMSPMKQQQQQQKEPSFVHSHDSFTDRESQKEEEEPFPTVSVIASPTKWQNSAVWGVLVYERADGSLLDMIQTWSHLSAKDVFYTTFQLMSTLLFMSLHDMVHHDLYARNILYTRIIPEQVYYMYQIEDQVYHIPIHYLFKIADWGACKHVPDPTMTLYHESQIYRYNVVQLKMGRFARDFVSLWSFFMQRARVFEREPIIHSEQDAVSSSLSTLVTSTLPSASANALANASSATIANRQLEQRRVYEWIMEVWNYFWVQHVQRLNQTPFEQYYMDTQEDVYAFVTMVYSPFFMKAAGLDFLSLNKPPQGYRPAQFFVLQ